MRITSDVKYIGVNDYEIDLFEGMFKVPNGMAYNSYVIIDEKVAIVDTVDKRFTSNWFENLEKVLEERKPDYLIIQHMEPDHSANIMNFVKAYPDVTIVASIVAFHMMLNYFGTDFKEMRIVISDGDVLSLGKHKLTFVAAPMVHWPEVMVTYDSTSKILFSADGFGKFGANKFPAVEKQEDWVQEARRYYFGIVGKYGVQVQNLLKKLKDMDVQQICPLHGPVLSQNVDYYMDLYSIWSKYEPEKEGVFIAYTSVYGNTKEAVLLLAAKLEEKGCPRVTVKDLARCDMAEAVADAFCYPKVVLAATTYNGDIFPIMREYMDYLTERNFCNKEIGFIENGSWALTAAKVMKEKLESCKGINILEPTVTIKAVLKDESLDQLECLAEELCKD